MYNEELRQLRLPTFEQEADLRGLGQYKILCNEWYDVKFLIDDKEYKTSMVVVPDGSISIDVLIGRRFLDTIEYQVTKDEVILGIQQEASPEFVFNIDFEDHRTDLNYGQNIPFNVRMEIETLIFEDYKANQDVQFPDSETKLKILLKSSEPVRAKPRRLPWTEAEFVKSKTQKMLNEGLIRPSQSDYTSPVVIVKKKDGDFRLCVDYRN